MDCIPVMYVVMNTSGKFLNINNTFGDVFSGIRIFDDVEEAKSHCIYQEEFVIHINITLSTLIQRI